MEPTVLKGIIIEYLNAHPYEVARLRENPGLPADYLFFLMQSEGMITPEEVSGIASNEGSVFGYGFANSTVVEMLDILNCSYILFKESQYVESEAAGEDKDQTLVGAIMVFFNWQNIQNPSKVLKDRRKHANEALLEFTKTSPENSDYCSATLRALEKLGLKPADISGNANFQDALNIGLLLRKISEKRYFKDKIGIKIVNYFLNNGCEITYDNVVKALEFLGIEVNNSSNIKELRLKFPTKTDEAQTVSDDNSADEPINYELNPDNLSENELREYVLDYMYRGLIETSNLLNDYYKAIGYISGNAVWEGLKAIADDLTITREFIDTIFDKMEKIDELLANVSSFRSEYSLTKNQRLKDKKFNNFIAEFTGGEYSVDNMRNFVKARMNVSNGELSEDSKEYNEIYKLVFGEDLPTVQSVKKSLNRDKKAGNICQVAMLVAFYEFTGGVPASIFGKGALASGVAEGFSYSIFMALTEGLSLIASDLTGKQDVTFDDFEDLMLTLAESFATGFFAGINAEILSPILEAYISKRVGRVAGDLTEKLAEAIVVGIQITMLQLGENKVSNSSVDVQAIKDILIDMANDSDSYTDSELDARLQKINDMSDTTAVAQLFIANCKDQILYQLQECSLEYIFIGES